MKLKRRDFINVSALAATGLAATMGACATDKKPEEKDPLSGLKAMTDDVVPISLEERKSRVAKAQQLLAENKIDALLLDAGTSMDYFTGISWGQSERTMAAIIPAKGEV